MQDNPYRRVSDALSEADCLSELMRLRFGRDTMTCPACGRTSRFVPVERQRALACAGCGHAVHPCRGTPLETMRTSLPDWFFAIGLFQANPHRLARTLQKHAGFAKPVADRLERDLAAFAPQTAPGGPQAGWIEAIARFVETRVPGALPSDGRTVPPEGTQPDAPPGPARRRRVWPYAAAAVLILAGGAAVAVSYAPWRAGETELARDEDQDFAPELRSVAPRPSMELAAVEEEVASAKAVVDAVIQAEAAKPAEPVPAPAAPAAPGKPQPPAPPRPTFASTGDPNEVISFGGRKVRRHLVETIVRASRVVGADPTLLMAIADKESAFATEVKAQTSSATGLYQFIEKTWLGVVNEFGAKHGLVREAQLVVRGSSGYTVADPNERNRILEMRREPYLAALMAGEMLKKDTLRIEAQLKRHLSAGEIYLIHFLGPDAAQDLMNTVASAPDSVAAARFPRPAEANKSIFYSNDRAKSVAEIRRDFDAMMGQRIQRFQESRRIGAAPPTAAKR